MATEEQTLINSQAPLHSVGYVREGQRLTISDRTVSKLSFCMRKSGTPGPTGDVTFEIRKVSDDSVMASKVWGDAADLPANFVPPYDTNWKEVTFDSPVYINEEVRICVNYSGGDENNFVVVAYYQPSVKDNEWRTHQWFPPDVGAWSEVEDHDGAYIYTYEAGAGPAAMAGLNPTLMELLGY